MRTAIFVGAMALVVAGCDSPEYRGLDQEARAELKKCPRKPDPARVERPPGQYSNPGVAVDYDKLVPMPDPFKLKDTDYFHATRKNPARIEQIYYDASRGHVRASWLICYLEGGIGTVGRAAARHLASLECQTIYHCDVDFAKLPYSDQTESGRRLREVIARAFEAKATELQIKQQVIGHALELFVGIRVATRIARAPRRSVSSRAKPPRKSVCFAGGTEVRTERGPVAIEDVEPGERVACADTARAAWQWCVVEERYVRDYRGDLVTLELPGGAVRATGDHPFWVAAGEDLAGRPWPESLGASDRADTDRAGRWVDARDLRPGDFLWTAGGGKRRLRSVSSGPAHLPVYNLHVAPHPTYAVGTPGVLVHNRAMPTGKPPRLRVGRRSIEWKKYSPRAELCKGGCEKVARAIQKRIGGRIGRIEPNREMPQAVQLTVDGVSPGWGHHEVVIKNGRVYDLLTGPEGQAIDVYKARFLDRYHPPAVLFSF